MDENAVRQLSSPDPVVVTSPGGNLSISSSSPTNTSASDGSMTTAEPLDLAALIERVVPDLKLDPPPMAPNMEQAQLYMFFNQITASQQLAQQQQQQQQQQQTDRKRSYPTTFQYCVVCCKDVHSSKLPCHIRQCHVAQPMFRCPSCDFTSTYSKNNVKSHMVSLHGLPGDPISYMDQYAPQVEELMKTCFPNVRGRGRPMQGRGSSPGSNADVTPPMSIARRNHIQPASLRRPSQVKDELVHAAQRQHHAAFLAAHAANAKFNHLPVFPMAGLFGMNNNSFLSANNNLARLPMPIKAEIMDAPDNGVSSSATSIDELLQNFQQNAQPPSNLSMMSLRTPSPISRTGRNLQPKFLPITFPFDVCSGSKTSIFGCTSHLEPAIDALFADTQLSAPQMETQLLTDDQRACVAAAWVQLNTEDFTVLYGLHSLDITALPLEKIELVKSIAPSPVDAQRFRDFMESTTGYQMTKEEALVVKLSEVKHLEEKLDIMILMAKFDAEHSKIIQILSNLLAAAHLLKTSDTFKFLAEIVVTMPNKLVGNGKCRSIPAFSVSRMSEVLACPTPSGQTLMSVLATTIRDRVPHVADVFGLIPILEKASESPFLEAVDQLAILEESYSRAEQELRVVGDVKGDLTRFLIGNRDALKNVAQMTVNVKEELTSLMTSLLEPRPLPSMSFQPERFFGRLAQGLAELKNLTEQVDVSQ